MPTVKSFGDSITVGYPLAANQAYASKLAVSLQATLSNQAVSSSQAADQAWKYHSQLPADLQTVMIGTNDAGVYGNSAVKREAYKRFLTSLLVTESGVNYIPARNMTKTGTWANTVANGDVNGMYTDGLNASATATVCGKTAYIGYIHHSVADADSVFQVYIDNVLIDTVTLTGSTDGWTTYLGTVYTVGCLRYSGLTDGPHEIKIVNASSTKRLHLQYVAGSGRMVFRKPIFVANIPNRTVYSGTNSDTNVADYCTAISTVVTALASDGLHIHYVDINSLLTSSDFHTDGVHLVASGHDKIYNAFLASVLANIDLAASASPPPSTPQPLNGTKTFNVDSGSVATITFTNDVINSMSLT